MATALCRITVSALLLTACASGADDEKGPPAASSPKDAVRRFAASHWDTLWVRGGSEADTSLLFPMGPMVADEAHAYVADPGAYRLVAFDLRDGSVAWMAGGKGSGPGEFLSLSTMAIGSSGDLLVADPSNGRLAVVSRGGAFLDYVPLPEAPYVQSLCPLRDGGILLATLNTQAPIVLISRQGESVRRFDVPWPDLGERAPLARQAHLAAADAHRSCVLALMLGRGFSVFRDGQFREPHAYVEPFDVPEVEVSTGEGVEDRRTTSRRQRVRQPRIAARAVATAAGNIAIAFQGETRHAGRLIDVYDVQTGDYLYSYVAPASIHGMARAGDTYIVLHERSGYPAMLAARPRTNNGSAPPPSDPR